MLILTVLQGPDKGRRFVMPDNEPQLIGRSSEALPLSDQTISRRHAELTPDDGKWFISDLQSANGTFVNGQRLTRRRELQRGDQIRAGNTLFLFGQEAGPARRGGVRVVPDMDANIEHAIAAMDDSMVMAVANPSEAAEEQLRVIYELTTIIGSTIDKQELLEKIMELIFVHFSFDRGFILLQESRPERPEPAVVRHRKPPKNKEDRQIAFSRTIFQHVMRHKVGVLTTNAMTDQRFSSGDSIQNYGIRSAMCVPIKFKDRLFGVIHIDSQVANFTYTEDQLRLLNAIGVQTGLALAHMALYAEQLKRERLAAVGQTVASLSHSTRNILQGMRGGADVVELGLKKENLKLIRSGWEIVSRNLERIYGLTMNMLAYSKRRKPELEMTNLPGLLEEVVELVQGQFDARKVALITDFEADMPPVPIDAAGLHQAVLNLLHNALDAVEAENGAVTLSCGYQGEPQRARIQVSDNGAGIDAENRRRLFEPFHSTKGLRGTGLGLVVSKKIAEEHGGSIEVESEPGQGTTFTLTLPCGADAVRASADTHGPGAKPGPGETRQ